VEGEEMKRVFGTLFLFAAISVLPVAAQSSATVRDAQQALKDKGFDPGPVDGVNGPKTREAVKSFQAKEKIEPDGKLGPKTLDSLGVKEAPVPAQFSKSGEQVKGSYAEGGKDIVHGSKKMGHDVKKGEVADGAVDLGKGVGEGAKEIGVGTGHAAKSAAKGVKNALTPNKDTKK
jgi:peptidoglycan hydrolase-like protein with peptidoglycan-binding domain